MASGRSDYWYGMLPGKSIFGAGQTIFSQDGANAVGVDATEIIVQYLVPANTRLYLRGIFLSAEFTALHKLSLYRDDTRLWSMYFDSEFDWSSEVVTEFLIEAGEWVKLKVANYDNILCNFFGLLTGFFQEIVV